MRKKELLLKVTSIALSAAIATSATVPGYVYAKTATASEIERDEDTDDEEYNDEDIEEDIATRSELKREDTDDDEDTGDTVATPSEIKKATPSEIEKPDELECPNGITLKKQTLRAQAGGYTVTATGLIPEGAKLQVKNLKHAEQYEDTINDKIQETDENKKFKAAKALDIEIIQEDGEPYQPIDFSEIVKITIKGDAIDESKDLEVYRISDDKSEVDALTATGTEDKTAEFETEHFTTFVIGTTEYNIEDNWYENWEYEKNDTKKTLKIYTYNGSDKDIIIPGKTIIGGDTYTTVITGYRWETETDTHFNIDYTHFPAGVETVLIDKDVFFDTTLYGVFSGCSSLTSVNTEDWDTSNIIDMGRVFSGCTSLTSLDVSDWDTSNVTDMSGTFSGCTGLTSLDLSTWDVSCLHRFSGMFSGCTGLSSLTLPDMSTVQIVEKPGNPVGALNRVAVSEVFQNCSSLTSLDLNGLDISGATRTENMFAGCSSLTSLDMTGFNTNSVIIMATSMFEGCTSLTDIDATALNLTNVSDIRQIFKGCSSLTSLDLSNMKTIGDANAISAFEDCSSLEVLNLTGCEMTDGTLQSLMFKGCSKIKVLDLSGISSNGYDISECTSLLKLKTPKEHMSDVYSPELRKFDFPYKMYPKSETTHMLVTPGYDGFYPYDIYSGSDETPTDTWLYKGIVINYKDSLSDEIIYTDIVPIDGIDETTLREGDWVDAEGNPVSLDTLDTSSETVNLYTPHGQMKGSYVVTLPAIIQMTYDGDTRKIHAERDVSVSGDFKDGDYVNVTVKDFTLNDVKDNRNIDTSATLSKVKWTKDNLTGNGKLNLRSKEVVNRKPGFYTGNLTVKIVSGNE